MPESKEIHRTCPTCSMELVSVGERGTFNSIRCCSCGKIFQNEIESQDHRLSVRRALISLILGMLSVVFGLFTGIPAIYFGIKSLRTRKSPFLDRKESWVAVLGILLGSVVGLVMGCCVSTIIGGVILVQQTTTIVQTKSEVRELISDKYAIETPAEIRTNTAAKFLSMLFVTYTSQPELDVKPVADDPNTTRLGTVRMEVARYGNFPPMQNSQILGQKRAEKIHTSGTIKVESSNVESWSIAGEQRDVIVEIGIGREDKKTYRRYFAIFEEGKFRYSLFLATIDQAKEKNEYSIAESDVKKIFNSFRIIY